jgi:hypothetical protein
MSDQRPRVLHPSHSSHPSDLHRVSANAMRRSTTRTADSPTGTEDTEMQDATFQRGGQSPYGGWQPPQGGSASNAPASAPDRVPERSALPTMLPYPNSPSAPRFPAHHDIAVARLRANAHIDWNRVNRLPVDQITYALYHLPGTLVPGPSRSAGTPGSSPLRPPRGAPGSDGSPGAGNAPHGGPPPVVP